MGSKSRTYSSNFLDHLRRVLSKTRVGEVFLSVHLHSLRKEFVFEIREVVGQLERVDVLCDDRLDFARGERATSRIVVLAGNIDRTRAHEGAGRKEKRDGNKVLHVDKCV